METIGGCHATDHIGRFCCPVMAEAGRSVTMLQGSLRRRWDRIVVRVVLTTPPPEDLAPSQAHQDPVVVDYGLLMVFERVYWGRQRR
jgi:hypothetical protein